MIEAGDHDVRFQEPDRPLRVQSIAVRRSGMPVIYTLLRDTLREMKNRNE
jgi:hypothetical protein